MIREGLEDREYIWLLKQLLQATADAGKADTREYERGRRAYEDALALSTHRPPPGLLPQRLQQLRQEVGEAVDRLGDVR